MNSSIIHGDICYSSDKNTLVTREGGYLVCVDGICKGIFDTIPEEYSHLEVHDYSGMLVMPGMVDLHIHAPQYAYRGLGMDRELLDWLNTYAFPEESKYSDLSYADKAYTIFTDAIKRSATTRPVVFGTLHREATELLMDKLEQSGVVSFVGKVNMDRNSPDDLREASAEASLADTERFIKETQHKYKNTAPIITPRFTPSCTDELMQELGRIAKEKDLPIQSHLSENTGELALVKELHPDCTQYWETYAKYGLWNEKTLMAHCVWSDARERKAIKDAGVWAVHCASSNENLVSGYAPVRVMLNEGLNVVLGSDIAGGDHLSMFKNITAAIRASKARRIMDNWQTDFLTVEEAFYLGTSAAAPFFGEKPGFAPGNTLHAIVVEDETLPMVRPLSVNERFERCVYRREHGAILAVYSEGRKIFGK